MDMLAMDTLCTKRMFRKRCCRRWPSILCSVRSALTPEGTCF